MGFNTYPNNPWPLPTDGVGSGGSAYVLPTASANTLGGVKVGTGLSIDAETGVLSNSNPTPYSLPTASDETLGGVKVGSGLSIDDGVLSATGGGAVIKTKEYTGTGTATNVISFGDETVSIVLALFRTDAGVSAAPFALEQKNTMVYWTTPNIGDGQLTISYNSETNAVTLTGVDAGQALNTSEITYKLLYM